MDDLLTFEHPAFGLISGVAVTHFKKEPYFFAEQVACALGFLNPQKEVFKRCTDKKIYSGYRNLSPVIPVDDVTRLINQSPSVEAERFRRWFLSEVLPQANKMGALSI
ncbi:Bro-N domain-containing protein [Endozoicomonas sp.]|uniref:BRO-N domain-containing protein n=1 Tax=Endozoicomonas sp. TaxID=1892382 RepID=UPI003AF82B10